MNEIGQLHTPGQQQDCQCAEAEMQIMQDCAVTWKRHRLIAGLLIVAVLLMIFVWGRKAING